MAKNYNPFMSGGGTLNGDDPEDYSQSSNPFLRSLSINESNRRKKQKEDEENASIAAEIKAEQDKKDQIAKEDADKKNGQNILQKAGNFIKDAAVDVKDTTVGAFNGTKTMIQSIGVTDKQNKNSDLQAQNSKEWSAYMNSVLGDAESADANPEVKAKWDSPEVQEKLKEYKYKAYALQGRTDQLSPDEIPKSVTDAQANAIKAHKDGKVAPNGMMTTLTPDPKTGKLGFAAVEADPYQKYRDAALTDDDKKVNDDLQKLDAKKLAAQDAETFLNVATLGLGTAGKQIAKEAIVQGGKELLEQGAKQTLKQAGKTAFKTVVGNSGKEFAGNVAKDAAIGGAYGYTTDIRNRAEDDDSLAPDAKNLLIGATFGAGVPVAGKVAGTVLRKGTGAADSAVSSAATKAASSSRLAADSAIRRSLQQIGQDGVVGTVDKMLSRGIQGAGYKVGDALAKTAPGRAALNLKDDFMSKWVTTMHPLYSTLKRSDFDGRTTGAYLAAREAIGNSNRALSYASDFIENNPNMQRVTAGIAASGADLVKARAKFDEFAKVKADLDLAGAGKKTFGQGKTADIESRMAAFTPEEQQAYGEMYKHLSDFYGDLNDFKLENGLISKEEHQMFKDDPFDYVRVQREIPDWLKDKPQGGGAGSKASITKSGLTQKRSQYASAEQLSPMETAFKTAQVAHVEAYRNKAAKTVYGLLNEAGESELKRTTDMVRDKQALLSDLKASKPVVQKLNKTIRTYKKGAASLATQMSNLSKEGLDITLKRGEADELPQAFRYVTRTEVPNAQRVSDPTKRSIGAAREITGTAQDRLAIEGGANIPKMIKAMVTEDPARLKQIRKMIESRDSKLTPLLDSIEVMNGQLHELNAKRSGMWDAANGIKTTVDKKNQTTLSFLDDGVENVAKIDPDVAGAIHNWDKQQTNVMNNVLRMTNNVFKYGTTGANAGFALPNFVADQVSSAINSKSLMATHNPVNFVHALAMAVGKPLTKEDSEILRSYLAGNKGQLSINQYTKKETGSRMVNEAVKQSAGRGSEIYTNIKNPKEGLRALFNATEGAVGVTENLTRIQNFRGITKKALKDGADGTDANRLANQAARENSVDFLEMGDYGRVINSLIPYFNASIQGSRTMLRNAAEKPASFAGKTAALVGVPIAATTVWNTSDPKRNEIYKTIPDYVKETNLIVITPNAKWNAEKKKWDGVILMKKPPGYKEFAEPVRKYLEYKADTGDSSMADFIKDKGGSVAGDFAQALQPIDFSDPNKFLSSVTPQILKPTAEAILNKNFFQGTDIVPDSLGDKAPEDQKYDHYSQLTTFIGDMFNTSPLKVDTWIRDTFGEVGTNAQHYIDEDLLRAPAHAQGGRSLTESVERRFAGAPGGADTDAFYENYTKASSARKIASSQVTELVKAGRINEAKRRAEEYNASIGDRFSSFMDKYKNSPNYDPEWDSKIDDLPIKTTESAFKARRKVPN